MAKTGQFADTLKKYSVEELKALVIEANLEIKARIKEEKRLAKIEEAKKKKEAKRLEAEEQKKIKQAEAVKLRDKLKIGSTASYTDKGKKASGTVVMIGVDKIQLDINGSKKSVNILKLV